MGSFARNLETIFVVFFSVIVFVLFFSLMSANGLILGNDPAIHLQHTNMFLEANRIPLGDVAWFPPLYHTLLATFMAFTGASSIGQILFLMKGVTALLDVLLLLSVYLLGAKFFSKKVGVFASLIMLLCFPLYELNSWGGYTNILSLSFMILMFLYLSYIKSDFATSTVVFIFAFSVVLSHQLVTFLTLIMLLAFIPVILTKSRGSSSKAWLAAPLGGAIAFILYYFQAILPHLDVLIEHVFFQIKTNLYQLPSVSPHAFMVDFGFILGLTAFGIALAFIRLRRDKKIFLAFLCLAFFVPLFLSQSYLVGLYLPYHMFIYYMLPSLAVLAAVCFSLLVDIAFTSYFNNKTGWKRNFRKIVSVLIVCFLAAALVVRLETLSGKVSESTVYYSLSDMDAYDAGLWLRNTFPDTASVVVTERPGSWFGAFSGKYTIAQTEPAVDRIVAAECVLDMAYEVEHPLTLIRAFESKNNISEANYVSVNGIWKESSYLSETASYVSFRDENDSLKVFTLASMNKEVAFDTTNPTNLFIKYFNAEFTLTEDILIQNNSYPLTITWTLSPSKNALNYAVLYLSNSLGLFPFSDGYIPNVLNWASPWSNPSIAKEDWAATYFTNKDLADEPYIGIRDDKNQTNFFIKFKNTPDSGNMGVLTNGQIDAVRFQYQFYQVNVNQTVSSTYQILTYTSSSANFQQPTDFKDLFNLKTAPTLNVSYRSYISYVKDLNIKFLVYDLKHFDRSILGSDRLELVYSNNGYVILKIKDTVTAVS